MRIIGSVAVSIGDDTIGCIIAGVVLLAIIVIVIAVIANKKKKEAYAQQAMGYPGMAPMGLNNYGIAQPSVQVPAIQPENQGEQVQNVSVADEIIKLKNLMESGVITAEEFEAQKKKLLGE